MKLRWHRYRNAVTTADYRAYRERGGTLAMGDWLRFAQEETEWTLQYFADMRTPGSLYRMSANGIQTLIVRLERIPAARLVFA